MTDFVSRGPAAVIRRQQTAILLVIVLTAIVGATTLLGSNEQQTSLTEMLIRMTMVVGLSVFVSNSGVVSFGHVGFMCIGAYAAAWLTAEPTFKQIMLQGLPVVLQEGQYPFPVALLASALLPAAVAILFGMAIMRLSGIAASIATFAFIMIVRSVYSNWDSVTAGVSSIIGIPTAVGPWVALGFTCLAIIVANLFRISRFGLMLQATRDDDVAAMASGISLIGLRLAAFTLSAALAGMAGGLYAQFLGILTVDTFYLDLTFITLAMLVVGGVGSLTGAVVGVLAVTFALEILRLLERGVSFGAEKIALPAGGTEIGLGLIMALILIFLPAGLTKGREFQIWRGTQ